MVPLVLKRKDAMRSHSELSWGLELARSRGVALVADASSPGWLRQKSSHIHVTSRGLAGEKWMDPLALSDG